MVRLLIDMPETCEKCKFMYMRASGIICRLEDKLVEEYGGSGGGGIKPYQQSRADFCPLVAEDEE